MKLKECFWLWGQDAMSHQRAAGNAKWQLPAGNRLEPAEGAAWLGIPNMCRVVMLGKPEPPFDAESAKLRDCHRVVWSAMGDSGSQRNNEKSDLEEVLRQARLFPNVTGAVLDDFFRHVERPAESWARYDLATVRNMREQLHAAGLEFYVVFYRRQFEFPVADYLREFDVVTYWNMDAPKSGAALDGELARLIELTPGRRQMTGCYIWNYGAGRPLAPAELKHECESYLQLIRAGQSEGIIFCSNCCADVGGSAVAWLRDWIREVGEEELPERPRIF